MTKLLNEKIEKLLLEYYNCEDASQKSDLEEEIASLALQPFTEACLEKFSEFDDHSVVESSIDLSLVLAIRTYKPNLENQIGFFNYFMLIAAKKLAKESIVTTDGGLLKNDKALIARRGRICMDNYYVINGAYPSEKEMAKRFGISEEESYNLFFAPYKNLRQPLNEDEIAEGTNLLNLQAEKELFVDDDSLANRSVYEKTIKMLNKAFSKRSSMPQKAGATLSIVYDLLRVLKAFDSVEKFKSVIMTLNKVDDNTKRYTKEIIMFLKENRIKLPLSEDGKEKLEEFVKNNTRITYLESPRQLDDLVACRNAYIFGVFAHFFSHESVTQEKSKYVCSYVNLGKVFNVSKQRINEIIKTCTLAYFKSKKDRTLN